MKTSLLAFELEQRKIFWRSVLLACAVYVSVFVLAYARANRLASIALIPDAPELEAEIMKPEPVQLHENKPQAAHVVKEKTVSQNLAAKNQASDSLKDLVDKPNQTVSGAEPEIKTHGPIVESSPAPKLPDYLKNQNLKTSVLIEFFVAANGKVTPYLIGSSGNEEVDALALSSARKWIFQPAINDGNAVDAKVRLRINFEVN